MSRIPLARPYVGTEELEAVRRVLESRHLAQGPEAAALEAEVAALLGGGREVLAFASGGAAILAGLKALGVGPGDEVVVPSFTFPAAAQAAFFLGAVPVPADVDAGTLAPTATTVAAVLGPRTRAVVLAHAFGIPADVEDVARVARGHGAALLEDAACSLGGTTPGGAPSGTVGDVGVFSLHPRKAATAGEGGLACAADPAILASLRALRDYGRTGAGAGDVFGEVGLNLRLSDLAAAVARVQAGRLRASIGRRSAHAERYLAGLAGGGVEIPAGHGRPGQTWQSLVVRVPGGAERIRAALNADGIGAGVAAHCLADQRFYRQRVPGGPACPVGTRLAAETMVLPLFDEMDPADVDRVCARVRALA